MMDNAAYRNALAIDVGTSFVEVALLDVAQRQVLASARRPNQQIFFGTNVVARLSAALEGNSEALQRAAQESVLDALAQLGRGSVDDILAEVGRIVVAANSVMAPLFCGEVPHGLAQAPFDPSDITRCRTGPLIDIWHAARGDETLEIEMIRPLDAFVGGDARAALIATGLAEIGGETGGSVPFVPNGRSGPDIAITSGTNGTDPPVSPASRLIVDLGTNAEIMLRKGADLFVTSVPAGPTFEGMIGGNISGLRGTDVIRMLADRVQNGAIDREGLVIDSIASLPLTQEDVRDFQLAKAAVRTGIDMLLTHAHVSAEDISSFSLVGAFGSHLDTEAAATIGLFSPQLPKPSPPDYDRCATQGSIDLNGLSNAALIGATVVALGSSSELAGEFTHVDLVHDEGFNTSFLNALKFA